MSDDRDDKAVREEIERRAYRRFCDRGGEHGFDLDDWLAAERQVLAGRESATPDDARRSQAGPKLRRKRGVRP